MSTLLEMRSRIADDMLRTDIDTQINKAINRAIVHYEKERFWFQETTGTLATVSGTQSYGTADGLPSDIKEIDAAKITIAATNKYVLTPRNYRWILDIDTGAFQSQPYDWAWYRSKVFLHPIPNGVWTITLSYQKSYTTLSADADTNDWTVYAEDLIEARASWWLYSRVIKDQDLAGTAKAEETDALSALREKTRKLVSTGNIKATDF